MNATKQTTYSWDSKTNATEQKTREFANYLLGLLGEKSLKPTLKFEIAPKETEIQASWDDAKLYCSSLNIDGKKGWRLPTKDELNQIYESGNDFNEDWYWSSTVYVDCAVWCQTFEDGHQFYTYNDDSAYIRAIRDLT